MDNMKLEYNESPKAIKRLKQFLHEHRFFDDDPQGLEDAFWAGHRCAWEEVQNKLKHPVCPKPKKQPQKYVKK
jgi:hypothetical protein